MLYGSETWPVRKENEMVLHWAEMRIVRWMCGIKLKDSVPNRVNREDRNKNSGLDTITKQTVKVCERKTMIG